MSYIPKINLKDVGLSVEKEADLKIDDIKEIGNELYRALSVVGFAYLENHGIKRCELDRLCKVYEDFFKLDTKTKELYSIKDYTGYGSLGKDKNTGDTISGDYGGDKSCLEFYEIYLADMFHKDHGMEHPDKNVPGFSLACQSFLEKCSLLTKRIFMLLSHGMKLKDKNFLTHQHKGLNTRTNHSSMRYNLYPAATNDLMQRFKWRQGSHTDYGTITLLFQDMVGGLQVQNSEQNFVDVEPIEDTIIINVCDILNLWSSGRLKSTVHRVVFPPAGAQPQPRWSIGYFVQPDDDVLIGEMEFEEDADDPQLDRMIFDPKAAGSIKTALEWLRTKMAKSVVKDE